MTDRELFNLPVYYEQETGLDKVTFEVPYDLFTAILKGYGKALAWEDFSQIKIHPSIQTRKTVGQCQFLFSIWMNDNLEKAIKPSLLKQTELPQKIVQKSHLQKSGRKFRCRT